MSDLFSSLSMASRSLRAQQMGLDAVGQNIANANTDGYSRRTVNFAAVPPADNLSAGGGVTVQDLRSARDVLLERRIRNETDAQAFQSSIADGLQVVEAALGKSGGSIDGQLSAFFDAFSTLAGDPTSATSRMGVITQGQTLASAFNEMADSLATAQSEADTGVRGVVDEVNALADRIAGLNESIARAGGSGSATLGLQDQLTAAVKELSQYVSVGALTRDDGGMDVTVGSGRALVVGANSYKLTVVNGANGLADVKSGDSTITSELTGGKVGGLLYTRDVLMPEYRDKLDTLAYGVVNEVNALHTSGYDLNGKAGVAFFTPLTSATGAAAAIAVNGTVAADPKLVAAASTASAGDNGTARLLAGLRDARVLENGTATFTDAWAALTYKVGLDSATAKAELSNRKEVMQQLTSLRDSISGVSLDEEAMLMTKFQRAYEANAKYFQVIDSAIDTLMSLART